MADWGAPRRALAIMFGALILFMGSSFAAGPAGASPGAVGDDGERITVREDTHDSGGSCRPRFMALGRTVVDTDESFTIRINVRQPLCTPL